MRDWQQIQGFATPGEYDRFVDFIEKQIASGAAQEVPVDPSYGRGKIYGGRWYKRSNTRDVWRLVPPDPPFYGLWEPVIR